MISFEAVSLCCYIQKEATHTCDRCNFQHLHAWTNYFQRPIYKYFDCCYCGLYLMKPNLDLYLMKLHLESTKFI